MGWQGFVPLPLFIFSGVVTVICFLILKFINLSWSSQDAFLQPCDGPFVSEELDRRQKVRAERNNKRVQSDNIDETELDTNLRGDKWKDLHMQIAAARHGLRTVCFLHKHVFFTNEDVRK